MVSVGLFLSANLSNLPLQSVQILRQASCGSGQVTKSRDLIVIIMPGLVYPAAILLSQRFDIVGLGNVCLCVCVGVWVCLCVQV